MSIPHKRREAVANGIEYIIGCIKQGDIDSATKSLNQLLANTPEPKLQDFIKNFAKEVGFISGEKPSEGVPPLARQPAGIPQEMSDDERRDYLRRMESESTAASPSQSHMSEEIITETIHGMGTIPRKTTMYGVDETGKRVKLEDTASNVLACGCLIHANTEIGGVCALCKGLACRNHLLQCFSCRQNVCAPHTRSIEDKPWCLRCYEEYKHQLEELTSQWGVQSQLPGSEPPPEGLLYRGVKRLFGSKKSPEEDG